MEVEEIDRLRGELEVWARDKENFSFQIQKMERELK